MLWAKSRLSLHFASCLSDIFSEEPILGPSSVASGWSRSSVRPALALAFAKGAQASCCVFRPLPWACSHFLLIRFRFSCLAGAPHVWCPSATCASRQGTRDCAGHLPGGVSAGHLVKGGLPSKALRLSQELTFSCSHSVFLGSCFGIV